LSEYFRMTQSIKYILEEEFLVTSAETDFKRKLKVSSLVNMYIQIAWHHAEELGFGIKYLHENNLAWVLSRLHLKINSLPEWNDTLKLITWPKGIHRLFYLRDLEVFNNSGNLIATATSEWLLIDTKTKRPKLQGPDEEIFSKNKDKHAIETLIKNLDPLSENSESFDLKPRYSDIDLNHHLTTTRYIDLMFDKFDLDFHTKNQCDELILNFMREITWSMEVSANCSSDPERNYHEFEFNNNNHKQILFRGNVQFKDIDKTNKM
jgi:medium-chain acyl-[acyl-carrier-protein] hydrolase